MDLLFRYTQEKKEFKTDLISTCELELYYENNMLFYKGSFFNQYQRMSVLNSINYEHMLSLNLKNGDFNISYKINNNRNNKTLLFRNNNWNKTNRFYELNELFERGLYTGEKRLNFWGVKYKKAISDIHDIFEYYLLKDFAGTHYENKKYCEEERFVSPLYDMVTDFHLIKKNIKGHDYVYEDIMYDYPKPKWFKLNDNKFVPAVLDSYGIKGKYLIGELSTRENNDPISIRSLNFLCKLFGDNYQEYLKLIDWKDICLHKINNKKVFVCKDEVEKMSVVKTLNNWDDLDMSLDGNKLDSLNKVFDTRDFLEKNGFTNLKFKSKSSSDLANIMEDWLLNKRHIKLGYKIKYNIPDDVIMDLEQPIICNDKIYKPKVVVCESDFKQEAAVMKNCMGGQFSLGSFYMYIAIGCGKKRVNTQYRKGKLTQSRGKTNIELPKEFVEPVNILSDRVLRYANLTWKREKYDVIVKK
jgi:hypothetical protein